MKLVGIARDLTLNLGKKYGYNLVAPVFEVDGEYFVQKHKDEEIFELVEALDTLPFFDNEKARQVFFESFVETLEAEGKEIGSIRNRQYQLVSYKPKFLKESMLREVDQSFHVQPDVDFSESTLVLGFSIDDDIFIGNPSFIVSQLELLVSDEPTEEEMDIMQRIYGMAEEFDKLHEVIIRALSSDLSVREVMKWNGVLSNYNALMEVEERIIKYKGEKQPEEQEKTVLEMKK